MDCNMGVRQQAPQIPRKIPHGPDGAVREGFLEVELELSQQGGGWRAGEVGHFCRHWDVGRRSVDLGW